VGTIRPLEAERAPVRQREAGLEGVSAEALLRILAQGPQLRNSTQQDEAGWALSSLAHVRITLVQKPESPSWPYMKRRNTAALILALRCTLHKLPNHTFRLRSEPPGKNQLHGQLSAAPNRQTSWA